jgi:hypothetical protein
MSRTNGYPEIRIKYDAITEWHLNLIDRIKRGEKITEEQMKQVKPEWRKEIIRVICMRKLEPPKILYPWHRRWWQWMKEHWQQRGEVGE